MNSTAHSPQDFLPIASAQQVIAFWRDAGPSAWFKKDLAFDADFRRRFLLTHYAAARRELDSWLGEPNGALALLILLDQFPRNAFRGGAHMFATDPLALYFAERSITAGFDLDVDPELRQFFYLPFEHSENMSAQNRGVTLMEALDPDSLRWAILHRDIIKRFGRFPHRNASLGRQTSIEEQAFLDSGGFSG